MLDLIDADCTFVNERLADFYGIAGSKAATIGACLAGAGRGGIGRDSRL